MSRLHAEAPVDAREAEVQAWAWHPTPRMISTFHVSNLEPVTSLRCMCSGEIPVDAGEEEVQVRYSALLRSRSPPFMRRIFDLLLRCAVHIVRGTCRRGRRRGLDLAWRPTPPRRSPSGPDCRRRPPAAILTRRRHAPPCAGVEEIVAVVTEASGRTTWLAPRQNRSGLMPPSACCHADSPTACSTLGREQPESQRRTEEEFAAGSATTFHSRHKFWLAPKHLDNV